MKNKKLYSWLLLLLGVGIVGYTHYPILIAGSQTYVHPFHAALNLGAAAIILLSKAVEHMK